MTAPSVEPLTGPITKSQLEHYRLRYRRSLRVLDFLDEIERLHWLLKDIQSASFKSDMSFQECLERVMKECDNWES